jgi:hypothetical protein
MPSEALIQPIRTLLQETVRACGGAEAAYWELAEDGTSLVAAVNAGPAPARLEGLRVPIDGSLVGMVLCTGMATALGPDGAYHPAAREATGIRTGAMAAAPVRVMGRAAGVLSIINPLGRELFSAEDLAQVQRRALLLGRLLEGAGHAS